MRRFRRSEFERYRRETLLQEQRALSEEQYDQSQEAKATLQNVNLELQGKIKEAEEAFEHRDGVYPIEKNAKEIANIITTDLMGLVDTKEKRKLSKLESAHLIDIVDAIQTGKITRISAKNALYEIVKSGKKLEQVISEMDLGNVSDKNELTVIIEQVVHEEPKAVEQAKSNPQTINFLVGKVMQKTKGKADPKLTLDLLKKKIIQND